MTTKLQAQKFRQAVKVLQNRAEAGDFEKVFSWKCGICYMMHLITDDIENSYDIMANLLTLDEYKTGLGRGEGFNTDREVFLEFLAYTLTEEDILGICNNGDKYVLSRTNS